MDTRLIRAIARRKCDARGVNFVARSTGVPRVDLASGDADATLCVPRRYATRKSSCRAINRLRVLPVCFAAARRKANSISSTELAGKLTPQFNQFYGLLGSLDSN